MLKDWSLEGPKPIGGKKGWALKVELKDGAKHEINVFEDGTVGLADAPAAPTPTPKFTAPAPTTSSFSLASSPGRGPTGKLRNFKAMSPGKLAGVINDLQDFGEDGEALDAAVAVAVSKGLMPAELPDVPAPKPKPKPTIPSGTFDLQPSGDTEKAYHMVDGQYFKGADGKTYQKLESGPKLKMGKKGPMAGVRIANITDGTEKVAPAFTLKTYYELLEPGGGGSLQTKPLADQGEAASMFSPDVGGDDDVFELLKKLVAGGGESIQTLAGKIPEGGYMAAESTPGTYEALDKLEQMPDSEYEKLNDADLQRVYETAEDVNWHTVAGKAWAVLQERKASYTYDVGAGPAGKGKVGQHVEYNLAGKKVVITGTIPG